MSLRVWGQRKRRWSDSRCEGLLWQRNGGSLISPAQTDCQCQCGMSNHCGWTMLKPECPCSSLFHMRLVQKFHMIVTFLFFFHCPKILEDWIQLPGFPISTLSPMFHVVENDGCWSNGNLELLQGFPTATVEEEALRRFCWFHSDLGHFRKCCPTVLFSPSFWKISQTSEPTRCKNHGVFLAKAPGKMLYFYQSHFA